MKLLVNTALNKGPVSWMKIAFLPTTVLVGVAYKPLKGTYTYFNGNKTEVIESKGWLIRFSLPFLVIEIMGKKGGNG